MGRDGARVLDGVSISFRPSSGHNVCRRRYLARDVPSRIAIPYHVTERTTLFARPSPDSSERRRSFFDRVVLAPPMRLVLSLRETVFDDVVGSFPIRDSNGTGVGSPSECVRVDVRETLKDNIYIYIRMKTSKKKEKIRILTHGPIIR